MNLTTIETVRESWSEREFQAHVRTLAEALGWTVWCTWRSTHSPEGEPDLRMARPPRYIVAELKTMTGTLTAKQSHAREVLERCPGVEYKLWRPSDWEEIERTLA